MKTGHCLTIGQTESGKTSINRALAHKYQSAGISCAVLDRMLDPRWKNPAAPGACWTTQDPDEFLDFVTDPDRCLSAAIFIDEAGLTIGRYNDAWDELTVTGRQFGLVVHLIAQRAQMVSATLRSQCRTLFAFNVDPRDAKTYALEFNCPDIMEAPNLAQGEFIMKSRYIPGSKRCRLF